MSSNISTVTPISIREAGFDDIRLQDHTYDNSSCLGLGDFETLNRERRQSSGGGLDSLLKKPEDNAMYEVGIMFGEKDKMQTSTQSSTGTTKSGVGLNDSIMQC